MNYTEDIIPTWIFGDLLFVIFFTVISTISSQKTGYIETKLLKETEVFFNIEQKYIIIHNQIPNSFWVFVY